MYRSPIVENKSTAEFFANKFSPCGPMITPEMIKPIIPGMFIFLSKIGDSKIMKSIREKINIGLLSGKSNSCIKFLKNSIIM